MRIDGQLPTSIVSCPTYHYPSFYRTEMDENDPWRLPQELWLYALGLERSAAV